MLTQGIKQRRSCVEGQLVIVAVDTQAHGDKIARIVELAPNRVLRPSLSLQEGTSESGSHAAP
jgi:hypothetical protein